MEKDNYERKYMVSHLTSRHIHIDPLFHGSMTETNSNLRVISFEFILKKKTKDLMIYIYISSVKCHELSIYKLNLFS